ncbi:hypothetical protein SEA_KIDNEYBEAN_76 [Gordonia phage KidneyBean]|uniref:Uncharacterized protein n=1 Tax=Gordonia phage KidneyBean TaxID=2301603 RepID=A0A385UIK2_9CAUD|nr:hypothetical protein KNU11_gp76 [Gordonia phage KidneyBean]AYB69794.1 hypothetical protein SEA_KIDNEYBEAN_76 [Gordonia phage KidneyBean]AYD84190.1 hypothetical protein SEA_JIFALL16_75 [Gordonia phage Jifall16]
MATKKKIADQDRMAYQLNAMDNLDKADDTMTIAAATTSQGGWVARQEPARSLGDNNCIQVYACELMARDIGRYVRFPKRFGDDGMSMKIVVAELRQISFDGGEVHINVGAGAVEEYSFRHYDLVTIYGRDVILDQIFDNDDRTVDNQNHGTQSEVPR